MCSLNGLVILSDLGVEFGTYDGQLPLMIEGHINFLLRSSDVQFSNHHNYVFSGVDYNYVKGYVCQCGEAFLGLGPALIHYTERFEQQTNSVYINHADGSYFQSTVSECDHSLACNIANDHGIMDMDEHKDLASKVDGAQEQSTLCIKSNPPNSNKNEEVNMEEDSDLASQSDSMKDCNGQEKATTDSRRMNLERKLICESIFRSFGYKLRLQYRTELGKQVGVSESLIRSCMYSLAKHEKKESPYKPLLTHDIRENAMKIHDKVVEQLETWGPETGYVDKNVVLLYAIHKKRGVNFDINFQKACQKILDLSEYSTKIKCVAAVKECGIMNALIRKPCIQEKADILFDSICRQQKLKVANKELKVQAEPKVAIPFYTDERLMMHWIFSNIPGEVVRDLEYRKQCAKTLDVLISDIQKWWKFHKTVKNYSIKLFVTEDIIKRSKDLDVKVREAIKRNQFTPAELKAPRT